MMCLCIVHAVDIKSLSQKRLSEEVFDDVGLESSSPLDSSLLAASANSERIALVLKHLPMNVSVCF